MTSHINLAFPVTRVLFLFLMCQFAAEIKDALEAEGTEEWVWHLESKLDVDEIEAMKDAWKAGGVEGCMRYLESKRDEWKDVPLNVAVIGNSGVGKSSFINAIRGLTKDDEGGAAVGVTARTLEIRGYQHPDIPLFMFWDLPGIGTDHFRRESYLSDIKVDRYDFFLLMTADCFAESDIWFCKEFRKRNKKFFFVRTKIGLDVSTNNRAHPKTHKEEAMIETIRQSTKAQLRESGFQDVPVFLIDSYQLDKFDFEKLKEQLIADLPDLKRTALIFSLHSTSEKMIRLKVKELRSRIWKCALLSAGGAAIPVPGLSVAVHLNIIAHEAVFYFKQLGLDSESLKRTAELQSADYKKIQSIVNKTLGIRGVGAVTVDSMKTIVTAILARSLPVAAQTAAEETLKTFVPVIGSLTAAPLSFGGTYSGLKLVLKKFEEVALDVMKAVADSAGMADENGDAEATSHS